MVGRICPPGWNKIKGPENLGATMVALVGPCGYIPVPNRHGSQQDLYKMTLTVATDAK